MKRLRVWQENGHVHHKASLGLVVGATDSIALSRARQAGGESVWILAPGVGAQGGNLELALAAGLNSNGTGMLIPVSRGISRADNPGEAAKELQEQINEARSAQTNASVDEAKIRFRPIKRTFWNLHWQKVSSSLVPLCSRVDERLRTFSTPVSLLLALPYTSSERHMLLPLWHLPSCKYNLNACVL